MVTTKSSPVDVLDVFNTASRLLDDLDKVRGNLGRSRAINSWKQQLEQELEEIRERSTDAYTSQQDDVGRRGVMLLTRADLWDAIVEGMVDTLQSSDSMGAANVLQGLRVFVNDTLEGWQNLLEKQEQRFQELQAAQELQTATSRGDVLKLQDENKKLSMQVNALEKANKAVSEEFTNFFSKAVALGQTALAHPAAAAAPAKVDAQAGQSSSATHEVEPLKERSNNTAISSQQPAQSSKPAAFPRLVKANESPKKSRKLASQLSSPRGGSGRGQDMREVTLNQLRELMKDVMDAKLRCDAKLPAAQTARETLPQFFDSYLNNKFGLRPLVLDWLKAYTVAVDNFAAEDVEVAMFQKMLHNELEEEFWHQQQQFRQTSATLLRLVAQQRNPLKGELELDAMVKGFLEGHAKLPQALWMELVERLYKPKDVVAVQHHVRTLAAHKHAAAAAAKKGSRAATAAITASKKPTGTELAWADLMQSLMWRNLEVHERALAPVVEAFKRVDTTSQGFLSHVQFSSFCTAINPAITPKEVEVLLATMDPPGSGRVTFSTCAFTLAAELTRIMEQLPLPL